MRNRIRSLWCVVPVGSRGGWLGHLRASQAEVHGARDLAGGSLYSDANGVSADGSTVTGYSDAGTNPGGLIRYEAFRWTASSGMLGLGDLPGGPYYSIGTSVSSDGSVVTGYSADAQTDLGGGIQQAFRWTQSGGMVGLGRLVAGNHSQALGISADGSVIVGGSGGAFRWTAGGGMAPLSQPPGYIGSLAQLGVSADGSVTVGWLDDFNYAPEAVRWGSDGVLLKLGDLPGGSFSSQAIAVSADGSVVVGEGHTTADATHAFRWTASGGMVDLGSLPASFTNPASSFAAAVSADGSVVVGLGLLADELRSLRLEGRPGNAAARRAADVHGRRPRRLDADSRRPASPPTGSPSSAPARIHSRVARRPGSR